MSGGARKGQGPKDSPSEKASLSVGAKKIVDIHRLGTNIFISNGNSPFVLAPLPEET